MILVNVVILVNLVNLMFLSLEYIVEMKQLQGYNYQNRVLLLLENVTV